MATIRIAIDNIQNYSADKKTLESVAELLRNAGHTVTTHGVGPNKIQGVMRKSSNSCDLAVQVAGGKCTGTLGDFYVGLGSYYHAKAMGFMYFKCWDPNYHAKRSGDDNFSNIPGTAVKREVDRILGKTYPEIYKEYKPKMFYGYGNTAEECVKTFLNDYNGGGDSAESGGEPQGTSILELIKQVCSDLDPYGVELILDGDTVSIHRTDPSTAVPLNPSMITTGQITFNDYDSSTPNSNGGVKDTFLIDRYGEIPMDELDDAQKEAVLLMAQRGHGHSIELKCVVDAAFLSGHWVSLSLPDIGIIDRKYYITKHTFDDEMTVSLTLEPGPPSLYVDVQEVEDEVTDEEETEDVEVEE